MAKDMRLVTITAGKLVYMLRYRQPMRTDSKDEREQKTKVSTKGRQKLNQQKSKEKLELLIAANFPPGMAVTLTYDDAHLPPDLKAARKITKHYFRLLRIRFRGRGKELRYILVNEDKHGEGRIHHHLILNAESADVEDVLSLWTGGRNVELRRLEDYDGFGALAEYLVKERQEQGGKVGARTWSPSIGLRRPVRTSRLVDSGEGFSAPPTARILRRELVQNGRGEYEYLKFMVV